MKHVIFEELKEAQVIDTRLQHAFQSGSAKSALNIPLAKFEKVAKKLLDPQTPLVFLIAKEDQAALELLEAQANQQGFQTIVGYVLVDDIPTDQLHLTKTISAKAFLAQESEYVLLDVREPETVTKKAPEKNLTVISLADITENYPSLDRHKEIYTLCGSGNSATTVASFLNKEGYDAIVIEGGVSAILKEQEVTK